MPDAKLRLLIAEKEYLIAIDAKAIVSARLACEVAVCTLLELEQYLSVDIWDLAMIDVSADDLVNRRNADLALATGAAVVFLSGYADLARGVPGFTGWPVVAKPFSDEALLDAVERALRRIGKL